MTTKTRIPIKSWRIDGGSHRDLLKAISTLNLAIKTVLEDWYPELAAAEDWDISSGGVVTVYENAPPKHANS